MSKTIDRMDYITLLFVCSSLPFIIHQTELYFMLFIDRSKVMMNEMKLNERIW